MRTTGQSTGTGADGAWQPPLEADPADAGDQARDLVDVAPDPEAPASSGARPGDFDLATASEGDLAEQLAEVPFDDDGDR